MLRISEDWPRQTKQVSLSGRSYSPSARKQTSIFRRPHRCRQSCARSFSGSVSSRRRHFLLAPSSASSQTRSSRPSLLRQLRSFLQRWFAGICGIKFRPHASTCPRRSLTNRCSRQRAGVLPSFNRIKTFQPAAMLALIRSRPHSASGLPVYPEACQSSVSVRRGSSC